MQPQNLLQIKLKFHVENVSDSLGLGLLPFTDDSVHYSVSSRVVRVLVCWAGQRVLDQTVFIAPRKVKRRFIRVFKPVWIRTTGKKNE